jgi:hypothetical protein
MKLWTTTVCLEAAWERNGLFTISSEAIRLSKTASYIYLSV